MIVETKMFEDLERKAVFKSRLGTSGCCKRPLDYEVIDKKSGFQLRKCRKCGAYQR